MATPVATQTLYADRLKSALGHCFSSMIAKGMCALWTFTAVSRACGVSFGSITERKLSRKRWLLIHEGVALEKFATRHIRETA